jgi:hypothetical protein
MIHRRSDGQTGRAIMNLATWNHRLDTACTPWSLVLITREFLLELPNAYVETLPASGCPVHLNDGADITSYASELDSPHLARRGTQQDEARRREIIGFFVRAARRVALVSSRDELAETIGADRAFDTSFAHAIGPAA